MLKIGYDAGHGGSGSTPGKRTPDNEYEWGFNNIVAVAFANQLAKYDGVSLKRFDDATGKTDIPLNTRTTKANTWGADYYISFHHNASTGIWNNATGVETYIHPQSSAKTKPFAEAVHIALVQGYGLRDRGVKAQNLAITRDIKCPSILVEGGFMDSTIDIEVLRDKTKLENAGRLIAQAVAKHLGLTLKVAENTNIVADWAIEAHAWVVANGISDGLNPQQPVTREQIWTMLHRMNNNLK